MKNKTVICHFYNEEYLLPWWLKHHREVFSDGLMIDYGSDDKSVEIIKTLCPHWKIVKTKNEFFGALELDREIEEYEKEINGYRIVLNVTEFLVGNFSKLYTELTQDIFVPMISMIDNEEQEGSYPNTNEPLTKQRLFGIHPFKARPFNSGSRLLHQNKNIFYPVGRHYWDKKDDLGFFILRYKHSPWNDSFIKRKMQIGKKQPHSDLEKGWGTHHQFNRQQLQQELLFFRQGIEDMSPLLNKLEYVYYGDKK